MCTQVVSPSEAPSLATDHPPLCGTFHYALLSLIYQKGKSQSPLEGEQGSSGLKELRMLDFYIFTNKLSPSLEPLFHIQQPEKHGT